MTARGRPPTGSLGRFGRIDGQETAVEGEAFLETVGRSAPLPRLRSRCHHRDGLRETRSPWASAFPLTTACSAAPAHLDVVHESERERAHVTQPGGTA